MPGLSPLTNLKIQSSGTKHPSCDDSLLLTSNVTSACSQAPGNTFDFEYLPDYTMFELPLIRFKNKRNLVEPVVSGLSFAPLVLSPVLHPPPQSGKLIISAYSGVTNPAPFSSFALYCSTFKESSGSENLNLPCCILNAVFSI